MTVKAAVTPYNWWNRCLLGRIWRLKQSYGNSKVDGSFQTESVAAVVKINQW